jgi:enamine deaminase RidA (YjgF/YER057c/UK114 family)
MGDNGEIVPGGIEAQTRQTLKNVEKALALAGCALKTSSSPQCGCRVFPRRAASTTRPRRTDAK